MFKWENFGDAAPWFLRPGFHVSMKRPDHVVVEKYVFCNHRFDANSKLCIYMICVCIYDRAIWTLSWIRIMM